MDITNYITFDEVRTTCGLSTDELPDTELRLEIYQNVLSLALTGVELTDELPGPGPLDTRFIEIKAIKESSRTALEQRLYDLTRVFCIYTIALEVVVSLSMKAPKAISDSKATLTRFSPESAYKDVIERIEGVLKETRGKIEEIVTTTVNALIFSRVVTPATDVVTGEDQ